MVKIIQVVSQFKKEIIQAGFDMSLMLSLMDIKVSLIVKVLWKFISLIYFRVYLEVNIHKNPTCFSRWSVRTVEDSDEAIVFFNEDVSNMEMIHSYVTNKENLTYQSIRILLNSSANPTLVLDEVNAIIGDYGNVFTIE